MQTVRQLLGMKQVEVFSVAADAAVIEAIRLMADKSIGAVLVMEGERLVGIVSGGITRARWCCGTVPRLAPAWRRS